MKRILCVVLSVFLVAGSIACSETVISDARDGSEISGLSLLQEAAPAGNTASEGGMYASLPAVSGNTVWRLEEDGIVCTDISLQEDTARLALAKLAGEGAAAEKAYLLPRDENSIRLCTAADSRVLLYDLALSGGQITASGPVDLTDLLGPFLAGKNDWMEVDLSGLDADSFLIAALDRDFIFHLYRCSPDSGLLTDFGTQPLLLYNGIVPYDSGLMIVGFSAEADNALGLIPLDPVTGARGTPVSVETEFSPSAALNLAWSDETHSILCTVGNTAYRIDPTGETAPVPFCVLEEEPAVNRLGLVAGDRYILFKEDGGLMYADVHSELTSVRIRVADAAGSQFLPDIASGYNQAQAGCYVSVPVCDDENLILEYLLNQSADNDLYVLYMNSDVFRAMKERGYCPDLGGSAVIRDALADMPDAIRNAVLTGDSPVALPIGAETVCLSLNVRALQELTGLNRDEIPTDWAAFLRLLNQMAKDGILQENVRYTVSDSAYTANSLKQSVFAQIMSDCLLWMNRNHADPGDIPGVLVPVLQAFNEVDWNGLGLAEQEPEDLFWLLSREQIPLLSMIDAEIGVMAMEDGVEYWPLSIADGTDRLIPETVTVMVINPWSAHPQEALAFMEYVWEHLDILAKMTLCQSMNEPVQNSTFADETAYLEQMIAYYDEAIAGAASPTDADALRGERDEMAAFLEDYRLNGHWLASEESIAAYRALTSRLEPAVPEFWSADEDDAAVLQFLEGMIPPEQFAALYAEAMKTARMEGY